MPSTLRSIRILAALVVVSAAACTSDAATAPSAAGGSVAPHLDEVEGAHTPQGNAFGRVAKCAHREQWRGAAVIGPRGGVLRVGRDYLVVPAGALQSRVKITGSVVEGNLAAIELEPHGLRFARPATLVIDASACDIGGEDEPVLLYLDEDGTPIEKIDGWFDARKSQLTAPVRHFSVYAVGV